MVELLLGSDRAGGVGRAIEDAGLAAPDAINPEVLQALRGHERSGEVSERRGEEMLTDFLTMPITRMATSGFIVDAWALRHNLSAYDACYVALARRLSVPLITCDHRIARAPNLGIPLILV